MNHDNRDQYGCDDDDAKENEPEYVFSSCAHTTGSSNPSLGVSKTEIATRHIPSWGLFFPYALKAILQLLYETEYRKIHGDNDHSDQPSNKNEQNRFHN